MRRAFQFALVFELVAAASTYAQSDARITLSEHNDLAGLVDLCVDQLGLHLEYDERLLSSVQINLRSQESVSPEELWQLTNELLATRGFTTVIGPSQAVDVSGEEDAENLIRIVKLADAESQARLEQSVVDSSEQLQTLRSGAAFNVLLVRTEHVSSKSIVDAIKPVLSRPGGSAEALGDNGLVLISDLRPRIDQALWLIKRIDAPDEAVIVERFDVQYVPPSQLAANVSASVTARNALVTKQLRGSLKPAADSAGVILVAPQSEVELWRALIEQFDVRQKVETRQYTARQFPLADVASLIEEVARDESPAGSGDHWKVVSDELTGTLIVSAVSSEHAAIDLLLVRLDSMPFEARRTMRSFTVRNRTVTKLIAVVQSLMDEAEVLAHDPETGTRQGTEGQAASDVLPGRGARSSASQDRDALILTADEATNRIIAVGDPRMIDQVEQLIASLDVRHTQVKIEVLVFSLAEGDTFDLGVELQKLEVSGNTLIRLSSLFGISDLVLGGESDTTPSSGGSGFSGIALSPGDFSIVLRALETVNEGRSLSMPYVLVNNNQQASLDSVVQEPFTSTNASDTVATTSFGGTQDAGTSVSVTPQIAEGDHLILEYNVTLSSFVGESSDPSLPPPRQQNTLSSVVTIPDGFTIAVGGLEITNEADAESRLPIVGSIPLIGEAFKNRSKSRSRSRFYVFIRANVLRHGGFEDLKYLSAQDMTEARLSEEWPTVKPRIIR